MPMTDTLVFIQQANDALARYDTAFFEANVADDVRWTMVGAPAIEGKAAFLAGIETMEEGLALDLAITNIIDDGLSVAVEGTMTIAEEGETRTYRFRDIYQPGEQGPGQIEARGIVKTCGSACRDLVPRRVADYSTFATVLAVVKPWAASGAAGLQESNGDEFRRGSQSCLPTSDQPHLRRAS